MREGKSLTMTFPYDDPGNQVSGDHKEHINAEKPPWQEIRLEMKKKDR